MKQIGNQHKKLQAKPDKEQTENLDEKKTQRTKIETKTIPENISIRNDYRKKLRAFSPLTFTLFSNFRPDCRIK